MGNFSQKTTTKKGAAGEAIVDRILREKGFVLYKPQDDVAHAFDRLAILNKEILMIAEVKTKAKRCRYPDTGIDFRHYKEYSKISKKHNLAVVLFFVDEEEGMVYGGKLSVLSEIDVHMHEGRKLTYPMISGGIIYFYREIMTEYAQLTEADKKSLTDLTTKSILYAPLPAQPDPAPTLAQQN